MACLAPKHLLELRLLYKLVYRITDIEVKDGLKIGYFKTKLILYP